MSPIASRLQDVMKRGDLEPADVARIVLASPRSVSRWLRDQTEPRWEVRERLLEFFVVMERLQMVVRPDAAQDWLFSPNAALGDQKPAALLQEGKFRDVLAVIDALGEGVFV